MGFLTAIGVITVFVFTGNVANTAIDYTTPKVTAAYETSVDAVTGIFTKEE